MTLSDHDDRHGAQGDPATGHVSPHATPSSRSLSSWQATLDLPGGPPPIADVDPHAYPGRWIVRTVFLSRGNELLGWDAKPLPFRRAQRIWRRTRRIDSDALDSDLFPSNRTPPPPDGVRMLQPDHDDVRDFLWTLKESL